MPQKKILFTWLGQTDLDAADAGGKSGVGPIARAVQDKPFDQLVLLSNYPKARSRRYVKWLRGAGKVKVDLQFPEI